VHAERLEGLEEKKIDAVVRLSQIAGVFRRRGDAVGDFPMVQNRAAACRSSHDAEAELRDAIEIVTAARRLISPE
jgi:hypothetical protein